MGSEGWNAAPGLRTREEGCGSRVVFPRKRVRGAWGGPHPDLGCYSMCLLLTGGAKQNTFTKKQGC